MSLAASNAACGPDDFSPSDAGDASTDAVEGSTDGGVPCDPSKDAKCVDEAKGIFVSSTGKADGAGTKGDPISSLANALAKAKSSAKARLYVCEGSYAGSVDIADAIAIYGGFACATWTYGGTKPVVQADKPAYAMKISANAEVYDLSLVGKAGVAASESSIGVLASGAITVKLVRVTVEAGAGVKGADAVLVPYTTFPTQGQLNGKGASGGTGGSANPITCPGGATTTGGKGGDNGFGGDNGLPNLGAGQGGTAGSCGTTGTGKDGTPATGASPAAAITTRGGLAGTWAPTSGAKGPDGPPGQGGGGGFGSGGGGGGGGGAGGCGGAGGPGGGGGGASIALIAIDAVVTLSESELITTNAGDGGKGVAGQAAQVEFGFFAGGTPPGCGGGNGGKGGAAGSSGGGAGGISVGIPSQGTQPPTDTATDGKITFGTKGNKGVGGTPTVNDGVDGVAQAVLQIP
ncbi:hypothetical protein BH09MYX1_BH09MYX1_48420 [soil metagenome]